jgi:hypothetical protein
MSVGYFVLWSGSLAVSVLLVALLRTRWGQSRPLHKCAVLSLLVHLMLAWAAMTVRFIAGDGHGDSWGPSIRVRVVRDVGDSGPAHLLASLAEAPSEAAAPQLFEPPKEAKPAPEPADAPAPAAEAETEPAAPQASAADLPEEAASTPPAAAPLMPAARDPATEPGERIAVAPPTEAVAQQSTAVSGSPVESAASTVAAPAPQQPVTSDAESQVTAGTPYSLRGSPGRLGIVEREGGNAQTEAAVAAALRWLAEAQSPDGRWDANLHGAGQEQAVLGHNRGGAGRSADTGVSGLALLAFLGAGHGHLEGAYRDTVRRGLDFLLRAQAKDGSLFGNATLYAQMYCHSMATFALAEAQAMTGDRRLEPAVLKAVGYCLAAQNATTGGWRYRPGDSGDTSQLGWQMMALASSERAGISVPPHTWQRIDHFLRSVRRGNYGGLASYRPDSGPTTSMTAEALYCRLLLGEFSGAALEEPAATEATRQLLANLPEAQRVNLYYWYYATLALHYRHPRDERTSAEWRTWNEALTAALLATQVSDGPESGSWSANTVWGGYGGRVYTTAMAAMCLEVYYRYAPAAAPQGGWTASRPGAQRPQ